MKRPERNGACAWVSYGDQRLRGYCQEKKRRHKQLSKTHCMYINSVKICVKKPIQTYVLEHNGEWLAVAH